MVELSLKVTLTILEGRNEGQTFELEKMRTVLGRGRADILFPDRKISSSHAVIQIEPREVWLEDLGSTNGTSLNDKKVVREKLKNLDEISMGYTRVRVHIYENLDYFKKMNLKKGEADLAATNADIGKLIDEELSKFSRWDIASSDGDEESRREAQAPKQHVVLEILEGPEKGNNKVLSKASTNIGRGKADIRIKDPDISRSHAIIECYGKEEFYVIDQASTNGTYVNNKRVAKCRLKDGDVLQLGASLLRFVLKQ